MAVKTITIDLEAYEILSNQKNQGESFSQVIKRRFRPKPRFEDFLRTLRTSALSDQTLNHIESMSRKIRKEKLSADR